MSLLDRLASPGTSTSLTDLTMVMAEYLLETLIPISQKPSRTGGWLMLGLLDRSSPDTARPETLLLLSIGTIVDGRSRTYEKIAQEKSRRLNRQWQQHGHRTSWQSRKEDHGRYGGAIIAGQFVLSFSGLEELDDEALVLILAVWYGCLSIAEATALAAISDNGSFDILLAAFRARGLNEFYSSRHP